MARTEKYFLGPGLLSDIRQTLLRVDAIAPSTSGVVSDVLLDRLPERGRNPLQRGTFTHAVWAIGSTMQVTIQGSTNTISVTNYCVPVKGQTNATQTHNVVFGRVMGTVTAVEIQQPTCTLSIGGLDVTELPGFDAEVIQLLGHAEGNTNSTACLGLQWYSVTQCAS